MDDCDGLDGPIASFRGATLRIQQDNPVDDFATLPLSESSRDNSISSTAFPMRSDFDCASPSEFKSGKFTFCFLESLSMETLLPLWFVYYLYSGINLFRLI